MSVFLRPLYRSGLPEEYLTSMEAAERLGVSMRLVRARCQLYRERIMAAQEEQGIPLAPDVVTPRPEELECFWFEAQETRGMRYVVRAATLDRLTVNRTADDGRPLGRGRPVRRPA